MPAGTDIAVRCPWPLAARLGEGALWWQDAVWFTDIKARRIHRFDPDTGVGKAWEAPAEPGFIAPMEDGTFIAGLRTGLNRFVPESGAFTPITEVEPDLPGNRLNDGAVDAAGRLWFGSMDDAEKAEAGSLYCFARGRLARRDGGYLITNGPTFSPDGRLLYHTDTLKKEIYVFDCDGEGAISNKRLFAAIEDGAGWPDGPVADSEGCLWTGLFGGWGVRRYAPDGALLQTVELPVANVTKVCFGGPDLCDVYVTTAWKGLDEAARKAQPLAGGLFHFRSPVPGLKQPAYKP
jgi:sugar lactone lactonase YvrE